MVQISENKYNNIFIQFQKTKQKKTIIFTLHARDLDFLAGINPGYIKFEMQKQQQQ